MKRLYLFAALFCFVLNSVEAQITSPNGNLTAKSKKQGLVVNYQGQVVLEIPIIGLGEDNI